MGGGRGRGRKGLRWGVHGGRVFEVFEINGLGVGVRGLLGFRFAVARGGVDGSEGFHTPRAPRGIFWPR